MGDADAVKHFFQAINARDADHIARLLTADHEFIDSLGHAVRGHDAVRAAWRGYFALCPDYAVEVEEIIDGAECVFAVGSAGGTIAEGDKLPTANKWRIPAAWRAVVRDNLISRWQVYADNKPVHDILARRRR